MVRKKRNGGLSYPEKRDIVAESVVLEGGTETVVSDNPYDNISDFIDDFGQSKRNFFGKASPGGRLAAANDARSLTTAIKNIDAKLGTLEVEKKIEVNPEVAELTDKKEDSTNGKDSPHKNENSPDSLTDKKEDGTDISTKKGDGKDSPHKNEKSPDSLKTQHDSTVVPVKVESPAKSENVAEPTSKIEVKEDSTNLSPNKSKSTEPPVENKGVKSPDKNVVSPKSPKNEESSMSPEEHQDLTASFKKVESPKNEDSALSSKKHQNSSSPEMDTHKTKESTLSLKKHHDSTGSSPEKESTKCEELIPSPNKHQHSTSLGDKVE
ncbi:hypothetical protein K7X08_002709 [Anisodus acutangulus]|uniref:Uncharacterized protein n=1 Tax=Anisodus acutangulus TaxID=402998 RepID=A0A9Q1RHJ8_9SOLA|nr:hypothetical protein K7X08_002709 [Anisodus acutangulus]